MGQRHRTHSYFLTALHFLTILVACEHRRGDRRPQRVATPDFLSRFVALAKFMRLSSLIAANVDVGDGRVAGNPGRVEMTNFRVGVHLGMGGGGVLGVVWGKGAQQVRRLPPDFLSGFVLSLKLMRLSLQKAAYLTVD
jgi:hypothetical protein